MFYRKNYSNKTYYDGTIVDTIVIGGKNFYVYKSQTDILNNALVDFYNTINNSTTYASYDNSTYTLNINGFKLRFIIGANSTSFTYLSLYIYDIYDTALSTTTTLVLENTKTKLNSYMNYDFLLEIKGEPSSSYYIRFGNKTGTVVNQYFNVSKGTLLTKYGGEDVYRIYFGSNNSYLMSTSTSANDLYGRYGDYAPGLSARKTNVYLVKPTSTYNAVWNESDTVIPLIPVISNDGFIKFDNVYWYGGLVKDVKKDTFIMLNKEIYYIFPSGDCMVKCTTTVKTP